MKKDFLQLLTLSLVWVVSSLTYAAAPVTEAPKTLLKPIIMSEQWNKEVLQSKYALIFDKTAGASDISKVTVRYFETTDCHGPLLGEYNTPENTPAFSSTHPALFGLSSEKVHSAATQAEPEVKDIASVRSVAISLKGGVKQEAFSVFKDEAGAKRHFVCAAIKCNDKTCARAMPNQGVERFGLLSSDERKLAPLVWSSAGERIKDRIDPSGQEIDIMLTDLVIDTEVKIDDAIDKWINQEVTELGNEISEGVGTAYNTTVNAINNEWNSLTGGSGQSCNGCNIDNCYCACC